MAPKTLRYRHHKSLQKCKDRLVTVVASGCGRHGVPGVSPFGTYNKKEYATRHFNYSPTATKNRYNISLELYTRVQEKIVKEGSPAGGANVEAVVEPMKAVLGLSAVASGLKV